jgi:hypothetical protein
MVKITWRNNNHSGITASIPGYSKIHQKPEVQLTITKVSPTQVQATTLPEKLAWMAASKFLSNAAI